MDTEIFTKKSSQSSGSKSSLQTARKSSASRARSNRGRETEEEAIIRRFQDAQRMARFRARKKKALEQQHHQQEQQPSSNSTTTDARLKIEFDESGRYDVQGIPENDKREGEHRLQQNTSSPETESKYSQLLAIIERLGKDVRLSYAGSRSSSEKLKSGISRARNLIRDCLIETRLNLRQ